MTPSDFIWISLDSGLQARKRDSISMLFELRTSYDSRISLESVDFIGFHLFLCISSDPRSTLRPFIVVFLFVYGFGTSWQLHMQSSAEFV